MNLAADRLLKIFVPGHSKTKGSVDARANGTVYQNVKGSTRWQMLVADQVKRAWAGRETLAGVELFCALTFVLAGDPIAPGAGDGDKLERNIWDALQKGGVIGDDVLITQWCGDKRRTQGPHDPIGVHVMVGVREPRLG